jgi:hypothetical protein
MGNITRTIIYSVLKDIDNNSFGRSNLTSQGLPFYLAIIFLSPSHPSIRSDHPTLQNPATPHPTPQAEARPAPELGLQR